MPNVRKSKSTSSVFTKEQVAAALAAPGPAVMPSGVNWKTAIITRGGGSAATAAEVRAALASMARPVKQSVAIRLDPEVLAAFRAEGPGWQTRMNAVLREWVDSRPKPKVRVPAKDA